MDVASSVFSDPERNASSTLFCSFWLCPFVPRAAPAPPAPPLLVSPWPMNAATFTRWRVVFLGAASTEASHALALFAPFAGFPAIAPANKPAMVPRPDALFAPASSGESGPSGSSALASLISRHARTMSCTESRKDVKIITRENSPFFAKCFRKMLASLPIFGEWCAPLPAMLRSMSNASRITGNSRNRTPTYDLVSSFPT